MTDLDAREALAERLVDGTTHALEMLRASTCDNPFWRSYRMHG